MAYTNAIFYMDYELGVDAARTALTDVAFATSGGVVRGTKNTHGLVTGAAITISGGTVYDGDWLVNKINDNTFDLYTTNAFGTITVSGTPVADQTFVVGAQTFTFKATRSGAGEVTISADNVVQATNIVTAILTDLTSTIMAYNHDTAIVTVRNIIGGTAGNTVDFTESATGVAVSGSGHLASGADSTYISDATGTVTPFGGQSFIDAWKTITLGATAARIAPGDVVRIAKSSDPVSIGDGQWTGNSVFADGSLYAFTISVSVSDTTPVVVTIGSGYLKTINATPTAGGSGYTVGDILTVSPGLGTVEVTGVSAGSVTSVSLLTKGQTTHTVGVGRSTTVSPVGGTGCSLEIIEIYHNFTNGQVVYVYSLGALEAIGFWQVANKTDTTFELEGAVASGVGTSGSIYPADRHCVVLAAARTKTVDRCEVAWTGGTYCTSNRLDSAVQAYKYSQPPANTKLAYKTLSAVDLDFSLYDRINFVLMTMYAIGAGNLKFCLCSDNVGATIVDEFEFGAISYLNTTGCAAVIDLVKTGGGTLGEHIRSVALYSSTAPPAQYSIVFDQIVACKTGDLDLFSKISKSSSNDGGNEGWYGVGNISQTGKIINFKVSWNQTSIPSPQLYRTGYAGATENVSTYMRKPVKLPIGNLASSWNIIQDSGAEGNPIQFQAGFDVATGLQDDETAFSMDSSIYAGGNGLACKANVSNLCINRIGVFGCYYGFNISTTNLNVTFTKIFNAACNEAGGFVSTGPGLKVGIIVNANNNGGTGVQVSATTPSATTPIFVIDKIVNAVGNFASGVSVGGSVTSYGTVTEIERISNNNIGAQIAYSTILLISYIGYGDGYGLYVYGGSLIGEVTEIYKMASGGVYFAGPAIINSLPKISHSAAGAILGSPAAVGAKVLSLGDVHGNTTGFVIDAGSLITVLGGEVKESALAYSIAGGGSLLLFDTILSDSMDINPIAATSLFVRATRLDDTDNNHWTLYSYGTINFQTVVKQTGAIGSWKFMPIKTTVTASSPLYFVLVRVACVASKLVTVKGWVRRDNLGLTMSLVCKQGQLSGVGPPDLVSTITADVDVWEELELTFTPSVSGVVEIEAQVYGGTTYTGYVSGPLTITQAA